MPTQRPPSKPNNSILQSLTRLGINITRGQVIGMVSGAVAGFIFARILPFIFTNTWGFIQNALWGSSPSSFRDSLNTFLFTAFTFSCSFVVALGISLVLALVKKRRK